MGMYSVRDPYPRFAELRRRGPIHRVDLSKWFPPFMDPDEDPHGCAIMSWTLASRVLRDAPGFSSAKYQRTAEAVMGKNLLSTDPPGAHALPRARRPGVQPARADAVGDRRWFSR